MGASTIRLLSVSAALAVGLALGPSVAATAAPQAPAHAVASRTGTELDVASLTGAEAVLDAAGQRVPDDGHMQLVDHRVEPPAWLLLLLVPILLGGVITTGVTLRRLR